MGRRVKRADDAERIDSTSGPRWRDILNVSSFVVEGEFPGQIAGAFSGLVGRSPAAQFREILNVMWFLPVLPCLKENPPGRLRREQLPQLSQYSVPWQYSTTPVPI
jgi:hypothetical protein